MKSMTELARIKHMETGAIKFFDTRTQANSYCTQNRDWVLVL